MEILPLFNSWKVKTGFHSLLQRSLNGPLKVIYIRIPTQRSREERILNLLLLLMTAADIDDKKNLLKTNITFAVLFNGYYFSGLDYVVISLHHSLA